jgi:hypothetical protein
MGIVYLKKISGSQCDAIGEASGGSQLLWTRVHEQQLGQSRLARRASRQLGAVPTSAIYFAQCLLYLIKSFAFVRGHAIVWPQAAFCRAITRKELDARQGHQRPWFFPGFQR